MPANPVLQSRQPTPGRGHTRPKPVAKHHPTATCSNHKAYDASVKRQPHEGRVLLCHLSPKAHKLLTEMLRGTRYQKAPLIHAQCILGEVISGILPTADFYRRLNQAAKKDQEVTFRAFFRKGRDVFAEIPVAKAQGA